MKIQVCLAGCWWSLAISVFALDLYVDPAATAGGDGSQQRPFTSLMETAAALPGAPAEATVIHLAPGKHRVAAALEITAAQTRGKPLVIDGAGKSSVSGGKTLTGWQVENGQWTHAWDGGPLREMFVNGERRDRSRFPKTGWLRIAEALPDKRSGFTTQEDLPNIGTGAELLFLHDWCISRIPIASVEGRLLKTVGPIGFPMAHFLIDTYEPHPRYCLENDPAFLAEKGTWCHDPANKRLIYLPRDGETPAATVVEIPVANQLLRISGTRNVTFTGILFEHCRWDIPVNGYAEGQATKHMPKPLVAGDPEEQWQFVPSAVEVERSEAVVFKRCGFKNLGGNGVLLGTAAKSCALENCRLSEISGNGIGIGEGPERRINGKPWWETTPQETATGNRVENSLIERCGAQFHGAVGIWVGLAKDTRIARNEIRKLPYTGVSVGWKWNPSPTPCGGNFIEENHIHHVMQLLSDGGGIYTLGRQPGTVLLNNLIHDVPRNVGSAESNGIFLDEGSSEIEIKGNLIFATDRSPLRFHKAEKITVTGNRWVLAKDIPPLKFNATDPAEINDTDKDNLTLDRPSMDAIVAAWLAKHPAWADF